MSTTSKIKAKNSNKKKWSDFKPSARKGKATPISNTFDEKEWTW
jgi:hypothetical protein